LILSLQMSSANVPPLEVEFGDIHENNIGQLRKINLGIFPVRYNDKFYSNVVTTPPEFTQFAYWNGFVVGSICSRLEPSTGPGPKKLYIMTLGVLAAYRRRSIGKKLLMRTLEALESRPDITEIYLHVQVSNDTAIQFYHSCGFETKEMIPNYYKRIEPPDCYLLSKCLVRKNDQINDEEDVAVVE